ncbi:hypothetical protein [Rhodococcus sp. HNM0569]|uniref:hypothetical protein n=1 Tax=Rhodococcus sp. HNM0569 TaxID=2716340 RepID=UPI00146AFC79|nr:hypothetical protein [Rhodococcus sp. HNM0569]NLU82131.1 hypothetical protein [Rhodococcus sp. HNM0569]
MTTVTRTSELPLPAESAAALARKPALMQYVMSPILQLRGLRVPDRIGEGTEASARLWWFGVIPAWTHRLTVVRLSGTEIRSRERGGPVRVWNHRLVFEPIDEHTCRYTDEIELEDGVRGAPVRLFAEIMFRHRHRRWRTLARVLS